AELVVRARHLIEDLVAVFVTGVLAEQPIIEGDRLERTAGICAGADRIRPVRRRRAGVSARQVPALGGRAPLEILIGFKQAGAGARRSRPWKPARAQSEC